MPSKTSRKAAPGPRAAVEAAAAALEEQLAGHGPEGLSNEALQQLMAALVRIYSAKCQAGERLLPFDAAKGRVTATDIMIAASGLLKAGDLEVFELGMWQAYAGRT